MMWGGRFGAAGALSGPGWWTLGHGVPWGKLYLGAMGQRPEVLACCGPGQWRGGGRERVVPAGLACGVALAKANSEPLL